MDFADEPNEPTFIGLVFDTETTGTDYETDEVIELGVPKFDKYNANGSSYRVLEMTSPHRFGPE